MCDNHDESLTVVKTSAHLFSLPTGEEHRRTCLGMIKSICRIDRRSIRWNSLLVKRREKSMKTSSSWKSAFLQCLFQQTDLLLFRTFNHFFDQKILPFHWSFDMNTVQLQATCCFSSVGSIEVLDERRVLSLSSASRASPPSLTIRSNLKIRWFP